MSDGKWYNTGYDGIQQEEARIAQASGPRRFWMPGGNSKEFVCLDDEPFAIYEHNPKMNGNFRNWLTCLKGVAEESPCCEELGEKTRYYVGYYTVVDCSKWSDKKGNVYQYELKLLGAKLKTLKKFKRKKEERIEAGQGGLVGCLYRATREDDKSPGVGDEFEFQRTVDMDKLFTVANINGKKLSELFSKATEDEKTMERLKRTFQLKLGPEGKLLPKLPVFNYFELLKPFTPKEMRAFLKGNKVEASGGEDDEDAEAGHSAGADQNVPF